jgi:hypothetical protein
LQFLFKVNLSDKSKFKVAILGCQRSGTTLLKEILHTGQIYMFEENWIWAYFARERWHAVGTWHNSADILSSEQILWDKSVEKFVQNSFSNLFGQKKSKRHKYWGIKAPGLNMARTAPYLERIFPELKFVIVVRDPRDTLASMNKSPKMMNYLPRDFSDSPVNSPDLVEIFFEPFKYWGKVYSELNTLVSNFPRKCLVVKYEEMIDSPKGSIENICAFLEIDFKDDILEPFCRNISNASVVSMTYSSFLAKKFIATHKAVGRWKKDLNQNDIIKLFYDSGSVAKVFDYDILSWVNEKCHTEE